TGSVIVFDLEQGDSTHGTRAYLDSGATVHSAGKTNVSATDNADKLEMYGGNITIGGSAGVGATADLLVRHSTVEAYVGSNADVQATGGSGLQVSATQTENLVFIAIGGAGGEDAGVAGSVVVDDMHSTTLAHIDGGAVISGPTLAGSAGVGVAATDTTNLLSVAGALAIGGTAGVGAGIDVEVVTKDTEATINNRASINAFGDVTVDATSSENITSLAVGGGFGGDAAVNVNVGVSVINVTTDATIAGGPTSTDGAMVTTTGNVRVAANEALSENAI